MVDHLAVDPRGEFLGMRGFSRANLLDIRGFAEACPDRVQQIVTDTYQFDFLPVAADARSGTWNARCSRGSRMSCSRRATARARLVSLGER